MFTLESGATALTNNLNGVCLSHWIALFFVLLTRYRLLLEDWRGLFIAVFALVWVANVYMSAYGRLRLGIKAERKEIEIKEEVLARHQ